MGDGHPGLQTSSVMAAVSAVGTTPKVHQTQTSQKTLVLRGNNELGIMVTCIYTTHVWQSRIEIEYYCIVYFEHISLMWFSGSSALQHVKLSDALEIRNRIIFGFYPGRPHVHAVTH